LRPCPIVPSATRLVKRYVRCRSALADGESASEQAIVALDGRALTIVRTTDTPGGPRVLRPEAQRILDVLAGKPIDRVPRQELFFGNPAVEEHFIGRPVGSDLQARVELASALDWGWGPVGSFGQMLGSRHEFASDGTGHYAGGSELTREALDSWPEPDLEMYMERYLPPARLARSLGLLVQFFVLHCFHSAATGIGMERVCLMVYDQPELLADYMREVERRNRLMLQALLDAGEAPDVVIFDADCAFKNSMMVSPADYRRFTHEPTNATCELLQDASIPFMMHTDGKIDGVYPLWIEMGCAGAHGVEKQANELAEIKQRFGDRLTLFGNFDPGELAMGSAEDIRRDAAEMVRVGKRGGRYVAAVNTIVGPEAPVENYLAFIEGVDSAADY